MNLDSMVSHALSSTTLDKIPWHEKAHDSGVAVLRRARIEFSFLTWSFSYLTACLFSYLKLRLKSCNICKQAAPLTIPRELCRRARKQGCQGWDSSLHERGHIFLGPGSVEMHTAANTPMCSPEHTSGSLVAPGYSWDKKHTPVCHDDQWPWGFLLTKMIPWFCVCKKGHWGSHQMSCFRLPGGVEWCSLEKGSRRDVSWVCSSPVPPSCSPAPSHQLLRALFPLLAIFPESQPMHNICQLDIQRSC